MGGGGGGDRVGGGGGEVEIRAGMSGVGEARGGGNWKKKRWWKLALIIDISPTCMCVRQSERGDCFSRQARFAESDDCFRFRFFSFRQPAHYPFSSRAMRHCWH